MGTISAVATNIGILISTINGIFFNENPKPDDMYWHFVFMFPMIFIVIRIVCLQLFYNHETPFYYLLKNDI